MTELLVVIHYRNNPGFDILFTGVLNQIHRKIKTIVNNRIVLVVRVDVGAIDF